MKTLTEWFGKVYVINCQHRPDRKERVMAHLRDSGMADINRVIVSNGVIGDYTLHPADWKAGRGAWGCLQSHRRILEDFMHLRDERGTMLYESALILEDDVFFVDDALEKLNEFMVKVPADWGQIYLGGQHCRPMADSGVDGVMRGGSINRTHAYAVSSRHVQRVYCHISYMPDYGHRPTHVDHQLELAHQRKDWPVYCPEVWIAGQEAGSSNVSGRTNERMIWE